MAASASSSAAPAAPGAPAAPDSRTPAQKHLDKLLSQGTDVRLHFGTDVVRAHGMVLSLASKVLANAVAAGGPIPMTGTSKEDWMLVMMFIYPVVGAPEVSYDNLEVLLKVAVKYDMPALLDRVNRYIVQQAKDKMTTSPTDQTFVLKWAKVADSEGLEEAAKACLDAAVRLNVSGSYPVARLGTSANGIEAAFSNETMQGLSLDSTVYLVRKLAEQSKGSGNRGYGRGGDYYAYEWF